MLKAAAVAALLGISQRAVYDLAARGKLACYRLGAGGGAVRFELADVDAYRAACRLAAAPTPAGLVSARPARLRVAGADLAEAFRAAGVKPRQVAPRVAG